jgi:membrane protease YdiL (CAAX protease family)
MRGWIRGLSFRAEFAIVFVVVFGDPLVVSIRSLWTPERHEPLFTNAELLHTFILEVALGSLTWAFLALRGWTAAQVGLSLSRPLSRAFLTMPLVALGLVLAHSAGGAIVTFAALKAWPDLVMHTARRMTFAPDLHVTTALPACLINPIFEEVFVCGYVVSSLRDRLGVANAVTVSAGIRVAYHLYQGTLGALVKAPGALIFAIWFARTRRLAPLIVAHAVMDVSALLLMWWLSSPR